MLQFIQRHAVESALAWYYLFSAAVSSMPDPPADAKLGYVWLYGFLHALSGDLSQYIGSRAGCK